MASAASVPPPLFHVLTPAGPILLAAWQSSGQATRTRWCLCLPTAACACGTPLSWWSRWYVLGSPCTLTCRLWLRLRRLTRRVTPVLRCGAALQWSVDLFPAGSSQNDLGFEGSTRTVGTTPRVPVTAMSCPTGEQRFSAVGCETGALGICQLHDR